MISSSNSFVIFVVCVLLSVASTNGGSSHSQWPLKYHKSPWLEKGFLVRDEESHFTDPEMSLGGKAKCDENAQQDYGRSSFSSCQAEGECSFTPSPHCEKDIKARRFEREEDENLSIDRVLAQPYVNPSTRILPNKDGRRRELPEKFEQCHYLTKPLITDMCSDDRQHVRRELIERFRFRNCRRFSLEKALTSELHQQVINSKNCSNILRELLTLDNLVEELACEYESILKRYDCDAKWSVKWSCRDCRLAYREWLCSTYIPYHSNGILVKPCQSICEQVEQKCPHLHPYGKGQYAGEPVFLCIDPNIPFNQEITPKIPFGASEWCYDSCDLEPCLNEHRETPVVDCNYNQPATTIAPEEVELEQSESATLADGETLDENNIGLFEEELDTLGNINGNNNNNVSALDNATAETESTVSPSENGEFPSETTTEFEWTKDAAIVADSVEAEFERDVSQTLRNGPHDIDVPDDLSADTSTLPPVGTTGFPSWSSLDEDYNYIVQSGPIEALKQSASIQYLELEPLYKQTDTGDVVVVGDGAPAMTSTSEAYQEIFQQALSPTRAAPIGESLKELTIPDDEIQAPLSLPLLDRVSQSKTPEQQLREQQQQPSASVDNWRNEQQTLFPQESVGLNHYRHSRSHRAAVVAASNSAKNGPLQPQSQRKSTPEQTTVRPLSHQSSAASLEQSVAAAVQSVASSSGSSRRCCPFATSTTTISSRLLQTPIVQTVVGTLILLSIYL